MPTAELQQFDESRCKYGIDKFMAALIIGKRATGKTTVAKRILALNSGITRGLVISPNEIYDQAYSHLGPGIVHTELTDALLDALVAQQRNTDSPAFLVLDNCLWNPLANYPKLLGIIQDLRELNIMLVLTMSYPLGLPLHIYPRFEVNFAFGDVNPDNIQRLYARFGAKCTRSDFCDLLKTYAVNRRCLAIVDDAQHPFWYDAAAPSMAATETA